jgi:hypothetical protein
MTSASLTKGEKWQMQLLTAMQQGKAIPKRKSKLKMLNKLVQKIVA